MSSAAWPIQKRMRARRGGGRWMAGIVVQPRKGYMRECDGPTPPSPSLLRSGISLKVTTNHDAGWMGITTPPKVLRRRS